MRLLLAYARHRGSFILRIEDAEGTGGGEWDEVLRNPRINRGSSFYIFFFFILCSILVLSLDLGGGAARGNNENGMTTFCSFS